MSKSISKPRTSGGQPQSNQRQNMPEFQRQDRSSYPLRQANSQGVHSVTQNPIAQVNMHPPHPQPQTPQIAASQVMQSQPNIMRPYAGTHTQQNPQTLVPQQQIPVGHVNSNPPQQANVMPQHVMRNNQSFQYQLPASRMPMAGHRPQYTNHHHRNNNAVPAQQIPNMAPQAQNIYYLPAYGYNLHMPQMMSPVNYSHQMIQISDPYQMQRSYTAATQPQMTMPNNIQTNEMMNQNIFQPQPQQAPKTENKKREKKILQVFDENGKEINLSELANDKSTAPAKESSEEKPSNETKNTALDKVPPSQTLNGTELDKEDGPSDATPKLDDSQKVEPVIFENDDKVQVDDSIQVVSSENETSNVVCDSEIVQDTSESLAEKPDVQVEELAEKVQEIVLQEKSESTDMIEVTATKEDSAASVQENDSEVVSATTISGDMEVDTGKGVGEPSIEERIEQSNANEELTPPPATKDDDDIEEKDLEPKLSRNSSQNGSRVYDKDFLLSLRDHATDHAISISNPDNMKDIIKRNSKAPSHDMFIPSFANQGRSSQNDSYRNKSQGQAVRRPSQPSKNYQDSKSRKITSTSLHQQYDIYTPAENAWKPGKVNSDDPTEAETETLLKNVRAILNKLTPQNYHTLLGQFKDFKIDTKNRLTRVIDLIFDKAVKEPSFVVQYAGFCSELIHIKVTETNAKNETVEVKFKNLLIKKCEETFFKEMYSDIDQFEVKLREIDECTDEKKKKELEEIMDDEKRYSRRRSIGNIKLIAELYKLNMLNAKIMFACFMNLLKHQHEEYIECLCALITNIGKDLTNAIKSKSNSNDQMESFESIFTQLKAIHDQKSKLSVSSRIRFMILDLLDLRKNNWVPRRKADGPKTIAQVHEDMDKEARLKSLELSEQRKKKTYGGPRDQEEWQQVSSRKGKGSSVTGQGKLSISNLNVLKESLSASSKPAIGSGSPFGMFAHGSHGGTNSNSQSRSSSSTFENKYHVLSNEKNPKSNSTFHDSLNAKDQLRRDERKTSDVTNYYQSNRDNSQPNSRNSSTRSDIYEVKTHIDINPEAFSAKLKSLVDSQGKALNVEQGTQDVVAFCSKNRFNAFICESILVALDKQSAQRQNWGQFLGHLFVYTINDSSEIFEGFKGVFQNSDDFLIDLPKFWEFVAEIIANALLKVYESNDPRMKEIFKAASKAFGEVTGRGYIKLSSSISESLTKMDEGSASDILSQLQFNSQTNAKNDIQCPESNQQSELKTIVNEFFEQFIKSNCEISTLENQLNIDKVDSKKFVSALFYKVVKHYIDIKENNNASEQTKLFEILRHYVKLNDDSQVELIFVSSEVCKDLNHPSNLLSELFTLFSKEKFATKEAFEKWKTSKRALPVSVLSVERTLKVLFP